MVAVVEGITADGHYDLDVKKSADPRNLSPYVAPWLHVRDFFSNIGNWLKNKEHPTAVQLPVQLVRTEGA